MPESPEASQKSVGFHDQIILQQHRKLVLLDRGTISGDSAIPGPPAAMLRGVIDASESLGTAGIVTVGETSEPIADGVRTALEEFSARGSSKSP